MEQGDPEYREVGEGKRALGCLPLEEDEVQHVWLGIVSFTTPQLPHIHEASAV